jgi:acyl-CoA synthetase (AMP-forming)/AMP-acid ligase II
MLKGLIRRLSLVNVGNLLRLRALDPRTRDTTFMLFEDRAFSYAQTYAESRRYASLFRSLRERRVVGGRLAPGAQLPIGIYQENTPEFVLAGFGAALSNDVIVGLNTGFRGETLAAVMAQAGVRLVLTLERFLPEVEAVLPAVAGLEPADVLTVDGQAARSLSLAPSTTPRPTWSSTPRE